jgi:hypothetical protein
MIIRSHSRLAIALAVLLASAQSAAVKTRVITFGKWMTVQFHGNPDDKLLPLKVRPLLVDAKVKEFTLGPAHDVTERLFVVQRAFRINDALPQEPVAAPRWQWQRGGWLLVDRSTGHVSAINLPDFDASYSEASWYRDYAAYCGVSNDGKKSYAVVGQIGRRKPVLKRPLTSEKAASAEISPELRDTSLICPTPTWQRDPARVTFEPAALPRQTFAIRGRVVDVITEEQEDEEEASK